MNATKGAFEIIWANTLSEVAQAQALRYEVFQQDFGIEFSNSKNGLDIDEFDEHCEHLLVRSVDSRRIVGTYRVLSPQAAARCGKLYSDNEFILDALKPLRSQLVEVGRSCVHPDFRQGAVILALWRGLGQYIKKHQYRWMLGCTSVSLSDGGALAGVLTHYFAEAKNLQSNFKAEPIHTLPTITNPELGNVVLPPLLKAYISMGAKICGTPAHDKEFNSADFLTLLDCRNMSSAYARHFIHKD